MTELQTKQLQLLNETIAHFNSKNRCQYSAGIKKGMCQYAPIEGKSEGCAVGRLIKDKELCKRFDESRDNDLPSVFLSLPAEIQEYGCDFLESLQTLHDRANYWNEDGLTLQGEHWVMFMKEHFGLETSVVA